MATRFYASPPQIGFTAYLPISPAADAAWATFPGGYRRQMSTVRQGMPWYASGINQSATNNSCHYQLVSDALRAQTIGGTVKGIFRCSETASAGICPQTVIRVISPTGTVRGTLFAADNGALSNEFATTLTNRKFPRNWSGAGAALSSVAAQLGDFLVIEIGGRYTSGSNTGSIDVGSYTGTDLAEDETSTAQYTPWIEFSQTLLWLTDVDIVRRTQGMDPGNIEDHGYGAAQVGALDAYDKDLGDTLRSPPSATMVENEGGLPSPPGASVNYYKRAWRSESLAFVYWTTTDPSGAYPGGGTLDPPLGVVLSTWI